MASRIAAALAVATESVQATIADVAGVSQNPAAMLGATAANAQATLAAALILEDMRRRWIRAERAASTQDGVRADVPSYVLPSGAVDGLMIAAAGALAALGRDHFAGQQLAAALGSPALAAIADQTIPPALRG